MIFAALAAALLAVLPDPHKTPGALNPEVRQETIGTTICRPGWTKTIRPRASYTNGLKREQLAALGYAGPMRSVEEDHRVPLEIGGNPSDPRNLWPEPWSGPLGAHAKDRLENDVHKRVCSGRLTLDQGRAIFLGDWTQAYRQQFGDLVEKSDAPQ